MEKGRSEGVGGKRKERNKEGEKDWIRRGGERGRALEGERWRALIFGKICPATSRK